MSTSVLYQNRGSIHLHSLAFAQWVNPDGGFEIGYHVELKYPKSLVFKLRVFKSVAAHIFLSLSKFAVSLTGVAEISSKRTKALEDVMADVRPHVKRLRRSKTMEGNDV